MYWGRFIFLKINFLEYNIKKHLEYKLSNNKELLSSLDLNKLTVMRTL